MMTYDGDRQVTKPNRNTQLLQFSQRHQQGIGPDRGSTSLCDVKLSNHYIDQDG